MVSNNLGSNNKKIIAIIIALFVIIVGLIIGVVIVNNSRKEIDEDEIIIPERINMINLAEEDCNRIQDIYDSGAITMTRADAMYEQKMSQYENDDYKIHLTICYANNMHYKGVEIEKTLNTLKSIEPLIVNGEDYVEYYDRLIVYYIEANDWDTAYYYSELRNEYMGIDDSSTTEEDYIEISDEEMEELLKGDDE